MRCIHKDKHKEKRMAHDDYQSGKSDRNNAGSYGGQREDNSYTPDPVKIKNFYEPDGKTVLVDLFDTKAQEVADSFIGKDRQGKTTGVSATQLRRIFDEVKRFEQILLSSSGQWEEQFPYIRMIKSKTAYSVARAKKGKPAAAAKLYENLQEFIFSAIDLIKNEQDYHVFVSLFEAAYGFYYGRGPKD